MLGGPALLYPDAVDTVRLWSDDPHVQLSALESYCRFVLESKECSSKTSAAAQEALEHLAQLRTAMRRGNILEAVSHALAVGLVVDGLALSHEFGRDLEAGQRQREGGLKGSQLMDHDPEAQAQWVSLDRELEGTTKSRRARAAEIARRTGANPETVRKYLSRRR